MSLSQVLQYLMEKEMEIDVVLNMEGNKED